VSLSSLGEGLLQRVDYSFFELDTRITVQQLYYFTSLLSVQQIKVYWCQGNYFKSLFQQDADDALHCVREAMYLKLPAAKSFGYLIFSNN
jgi:hypothetical protein